MMYAALDVGGTFIKYAITDENGQPLPDTVGQTPMNSDGSLDEIYAAFEETVHRLHVFAPEVQNAAISIPGPFDYQNGVSHMKHKFAALDGVSVKDFLLSKGLNALFLHDSTAFLLGEMYCGAAEGAKMPFGVMLGTGFGFAMAIEGKVCVNTEQRPALSLWSKPFHGGIVEDSISRKSLRAKYKRLSGGEENKDVKEIAEAARKGDAQAMQVMQELGQDLGELLLPYVHRFSCDRLVVGGQIARSGDLFLPVAAQKLGILVVPAAHLDDAALRGAAIYARDGHKNVREYQDGAFD